MAAPAHNTSTVSQDTLITIKVSVNSALLKLKLPLRDLGANVLPDKLRQLLAIKPEQTVTFERFSDSAGGYITLDPNNPQVFKTLIRAAKAKLKLRLKATVSPLPEQERSEVPEMAEEKAEQKPSEPVIVRSPVYQNSPRDSTAIDGRSVGSGIFQFREARASQQTLVDTSEAPVPQPFSSNDNKDFFETLAEKGSRRGLVFRSRGTPAAVNNHGHPWSVYCNECDVAMDNAHFHCSICDGGDYDLCERCVTSGKLCPGEGHWLIKRFIQDGKVISSTTERIQPRAMNLAQALEHEIKKDMPGAFADETKTLAEPPSPTRTCNNCVVVLPEREFVTCTSCEDFDLCVKCHMSNRHGHHPAHAFKPATEETVLPLTAETMLAPGRNVRHNAICDGCDKKIYGVRHKCLNCPDWDYCNDCIKNVKHIHPRHRFAAVYDPIPEPHACAVRHSGIYCDGPLCSSGAKQGYIQGVRYKCAVCHDTDFCASCEALPSNPHNRTHPLIKFKTPVRNVSITTENEDLRGQMRYMGDRRPQSAQAETKSASTETTPVAQSNAATQVQTVAEIKPTEEKPIIKSEEPKSASPVASTEAVPATVLNAHFVKDSIADGTVVEPNARFTQVWTLRNPGPYTWPAGCSVRFVGGDNMLNVDNTRPAAVTDIADATESNCIGRDVQVGEQVAFMITLKAPSREGKAISYWRMKAADGTPFGHRLWCDVQIKKPVEAPIVPKSLPAQSPFNTPFDASQQAQLSRMQAIRRQQMQMQMHQQMLAQQAAQRQAAVNTYGQPPAYNDANASSANISARIAAMREQQAKRRENMMQQFNAHREQLQAQGIKREDMPSWNQHVNPTIGSTAEQNDEEKARKEAARQRVEHIKAKILRAREEKSKAIEAAQKAAAEKKTAEETEKVKKIIAEVTKAEEEKKNEEAESETDDIEGSQMVFPKLEKESPASSTYQSLASSASKGKAAYVENELGEVERSATPVTAPAPAAALLSPTTESEDTFEDLEDDLEVLSADEEESDDGFLTDEEYDILDASDQETVASK
ncbi:hypothetical protein LTR37_011852 [Vermiconidia calcicola]|uniref:Uncharacterized protein n=1 Tax=Vermiconidia calcicola TaxID=1690605 RepID=A0ACC3N1A7_9PEZI|nr:hypothetical protein LTR37_011852 [Vermiconidia calcicola]